MPTNKEDSVGNVRQRWGRLWCCWQGDCEDEKLVTAAKKHAAGQIVVCQATGSSCETPTPQAVDTLSDAGSPESTVWYDCNEEFDLEAEVQNDCTDADTDGWFQHAYAALPQQLGRIIKQYKQGIWVGCKPTVAVMKYMEGTGTSMHTLQQQLAQVIAAEQAVSAKTCSTDRPPAAQETLTQKAVDVMHSSSNKVLQQHQLQSQRDVGPSIARLLYNIELIGKTLTGMSQVEGFQQVAHGKLELWYKHDTVNQRQLLKAKTVLDEPVVHAVCLAREVDLVPGWNPAILDARELKAYSPSELLVYMLNWCPWPLPCPEVLNYAVGVDLLDTAADCVLLATSAPTDSQMEGVTTPQHARTIRMTMHAGGFKFTPLPPDPAKPDVPRMEAIVLISFDAKKFVVPDAIISFILKIIAPLIHKSVLKVLETLFHGQAHPASKSSHSLEDDHHSKLLDRLKARPEYTALHEHCGKYIDSLIRQQQP